MKRFWMLGTFFLFSVVHVPASLAYCSQFSDWYKARQIIIDQKKPSPVKLSELRGVEIKKRETLVQLLVESYFQNDLSLSEVEGCLANISDRQNFLNTFQSAFLKKSVSKLKELGSLKLKKVLERYENQFAVNSIPLFRITGHIFGKENPTPQKGGYHRGSQSIFMNIQKVSVDEWLLILTHEIIHAIDPELKAASQKFSDQKIMDDLTMLADKSDDRKDLSSEEKAIVHNWLLAGLNRGFLAEYRAWLLTLQIAQEVKSTGALGEIVWLNQFFENNPGDLKEAIFKILDEGFSDPKEGIYSRQLIQKELTLLRQGFRLSLPAEIN